MEEYVEIAKFTAGALLAKGPLTKLIEVGQAAVGTWYKPRAMRNEADAKAYELETMAYAQAKADIIKTNAESEMADRARHRLYQQEMQRQRNIENILDQTESQLNETVSDTPVDQEWRTRFFNKAQDISSEELQKLWGKILGEEISQPGSVSLRTLDILSNLSKTEAETFLKIAPYCTKDGYILKDTHEDIEKYKIEYNDILILQSTGLMVVSDTLGFSKKKVEVILDISDSEQIKSGLIFKYLKCALFLNHETTDVEQIKFGCYSLTNTGIELLKIIEYNDDTNFILAIKNKYEAQGFFTLLINLI